MIFLLKKPKCHADQSNATARESWEIPKALIRFYLAIVTTVLVVIGIELSTPNQHLSELFITYLAETSATAHWVFTHDWISKFFPAHVDETTRALIYAGSTAKFITVSMLLVLYFVLVISNDPLSNTQLIRNLNTRSYDENREKLPLNIRYMTELRFYAKNTPSARIEALCGGCDISVGCGNSIGKHTTDNALSLWVSIYHHLSATTVHELLFRTNRCRAVALLRYALWVSAISLILVYPAARAFEWLRDVPVQANLVLVGYIVLLMLGSLAVGRLLYGGENARGIWGHFIEPASMNLNQAA
jgi:hypothetical protein